MSEDIMYTALLYIAAEGDDEIPLGDGLSLVKPTEHLLANRLKLVMGDGEFEDEATASRYLVCKYPSWIPGRNASEVGTDRFYSGLMAIQVIKPVQTLGFIYRGQGVERRTPMNAGEWARMKRFDDDMLARVPAMIERIQRVADGDNAERKNALILLQLGLEHFHPYIAGLLWVMGLEAIFDSANRNEFKRKLCDCLGATTLAFPDWNEDVKAPPYTVEEIAIPLYMLRNKLAHGADLRKASTDKTTPVDLTAKVKLTDFTEPTGYALLLSEAACHLLCQVLQRVL
jgi:hypothetical protein